MIARLILLVGACLMAHASLAGHANDAVRLDETGPSKNGANEPAAIEPQHAAGLPVEPDPRGPGFSFLPAADFMVETRILPLFTHLADDALKLQNAVIRQCAGETEASQASLDDIFAAVIETSTEALPFAFGSDAARAFPGRLLTEAASTVFSRDRLEAMSNGLTPAPNTLADLRQEEPALMGLSALERLLMAQSYTSEETLENRCNLALPIAANIVDTTTAVQQAWLSRELDTHWVDDAEELADRLRLRDLIQGTIDTIDRLERDISEFSRQSRNNGKLPFAYRRNSLAYVMGLSRSLIADIELLKLFALSGGEAEAWLDDIAMALKVGQERLETEDQDGTSYLVAFDQAHADIIERLPDLFGFDESAFTSAISSFELHRSERR